LRVACLLLIWSHPCASTQESDANDDNALCRFEFLEVIVRIAFAKYIASKVGAPAARCASPPPSTSTT
jgi:hypothetical protein